MIVQVEHLSDSKEWQQMPNKEEEDEEEEKKKSRLFFISWNINLSSFLRLKIFCRNPLRWTFLPVDGGPETKTVTNKLWDPQVLWTKAKEVILDRRLGLMEAICHLVFIKYSSKSKVCRKTTITSSKRPEGTDCWQRCFSIWFFSCVGNYVWRLSLHECFLSLWSALLNVFSCMIL